MLSLPSWGRGLKRVGLGVDVADDGVAPFVGAWIETRSPSAALPSFVSLPSWGRGLKLCSSPALVVYQLVAPFVGAWIETR